MINIDSKNALSMMKFDMEIAKTQYFDVAKRCWRLSNIKGEMEGVLPRVRCQIIADFYRKMQQSGRRLPFVILRRQNAKKRHLSRNAVGGCRRVSHAERKPCMLTTVEELKVKLSINNKKSMLIPNLVTFHSSAYLRSLGDSLLLFWAFFALC